MSDPTVRADVLDASANSPAGEVSGVAVDETSSAGTRGALAVGKRWRNYTVKSEIPGVSAGCFLATEVSVMADVVLQMYPLDAENEERRRIWEILQGLSGENFVRATEAHEEAGFRYEIFPLPPGQSLREWLGAHRTNAAMIEAVVQQLARAIEALHQAGLVHLNLRPETVFIEEDDQQLKIMIGGLHQARRMDQSGLATIEVNPYYAPPEAGGLSRHESGASMCTWDWWALGRIVQEMVLGKHVYSLVMERDVRANPPELRARAEALLLERDPTALRAGAVELLPEDTGSRLRLVLRGLLASVRDGRWRWREVEAWSRGAQPVDRYDLPRDTRLIRHGEQALTLAEIAGLYAQPKYFAEGVGQLFPAEGAPETVWAILRETAQFRTELDRVRPLREMMTISPWQGQPVELCQAAVAGLIWLTLAAPGQRPPLCLGEHMLGVAGLRDLFRQGTAFTAEAMLAVLTAEPYRQRVAPLDPAAKNALDLLAKTGREAVALAKTQGWPFIARPKGLARLLEWVLASDAELAANRAGLRARYAVSSDALLNAWLHAPAPASAELALLAATGEQAAEHGYIPHDEWSRQRHGELMARATLVSRALFWRRLRQMLAFNPSALGFWPVSAALWLLPLAFGLLTHAWLLAALTALLAIGVRLAGTLAVRRLIARYAPGGTLWRWNDDTGRCRREELALLPGQAPASLRQLEAEMNRIRHDLSGLTLPAGMARPADSPRFNAVWTGTAMATLAPVVLLIVIGARHQGAFAPTASGPTPVATAASVPLVEPEPLIEVIGADGKVGLYEIVNDGFGGRRRGPLKRWDVPKPAVPIPLQVTSQAPASGAQSAFAVVSAELLLEPYPRHGRNVLVAVAIPRLRDLRPSIILYDSVTGRLADGLNYGLGSDLTPLSWYTLSGREVVYLGLPAAMQGDDLIPLP